MSVANAASNVGSDGAPARIPPAELVVSVQLDSYSATENMVGSRQAIDKSGAPGTIRTCDLCLRRAALYPAELRVLSANRFRTIGKPGGAGNGLGKSPPHPGPLLPSGEERESKVGADCVPPPPFGGRGTGGGGVAYARWFSLFPQAPGARSARLATRLSVLFFGFVHEVCLTRITRQLQITLSPHVASHTTLQTPSQHIRRILCKSDPSGRGVVRPTAALGS